MRVRVSQKIQLVIYSLVNFVGLLSVILGENPASWLAVRLSSGETMADFWQTAQTVTESIYLSGTPFVFLLSLVLFISLRYTRSDKAKRLAIANIVSSLFVSSYWWIFNLNLIVSSRLKLFLL